MGGHSARQGVPELHNLERIHTADFPLLSRDHVIHHASSGCILVVIKLHTPEQSKRISIGWHIHVRFASTSQLELKGQHAL